MVLAQQGKDTAPTALVPGVSTGYQFVQTRGLVVLNTPVGLVACLPVGMAQVSSVVITAEQHFMQGAVVGHCAGALRQMGGLRKAAAP